ncbi:SIMPL domain-containing protein [Nocardia yamanashiensis]|uniref:SIMPL domain-containing protein n=1 Tax=Nocardia yamanashiensis TaxID=209247 RepID=UPI001E529707|nr:SIMPL domain-containing protein [Nocardia yamanashiensis]UGT42696.1 SIMPL domain-containing protein [Nocardia yamanashiensis]
MSSTDTAGTITMSGSGSASATPDLMRVTVSVESRAETVAAAYARAGERTEAITAALRADGVQGRDIGTSGLSVRTETVWTDGNRERVIGYLASTSLTVTLRDIGTGAAKSDSGPAAIIAHAVDAGGDDVRLGGLTLAVADEAELVATARDSAWDDALAKAERYAARAGRSLGAVVEITENVGAAPVNREIAFVAKSAPMGAAPVPVELGESQLSATVQVTWRLN